MLTIPRSVRVAISTVLVLVLFPVASEPSQAATVLPGFQLTTVWSGLNSPASLAFAPNGRVFVAERAGVIKTFDSVSDPTPTVTADLSANVHAVADRGMLGLAVDPGFPTRPYIYVSYTLDAPPGGTAPYYHDACPLNNGFKDGCPATGRVSRLTIDGAGRMTGAEQVVIGGSFWCHQHQAHAIDHLAFGPDGALYASSGDGASATFTDWGQHQGSTTAVAPNACGDPPVPAGTRLSLPTTEGGALRSQDLRTSGDPAGGSGTVVRVNPDTGAALPDNPLVGGDVSDDRIVAYGLRNPFRFTFRPGSSEIWVADVGWNTWEELNLIPSPTAAPRNFGWPCYEGTPRQPQYDGINVNLCESLYASGAGAVTPPHWSYRHNLSPDAARCGNAGSALSALAFATSPPYPAAYQGALFAGDYVKACLWILRPGSNGQPNPATLETLATGVFPVDLDSGPGGLLYVVDIAQGTVSRIDYFADNEPPVARMAASSTSGPVPLNVHFDGSGSTDADGPAPLEYTWDLDGDGAYDDATGVTADATYTEASNVVVGLRVEDGMGAAGTASLQLHPGNAAPDVRIDAPTSALRWSSGEEIVFAGTATDAEDGDISSSITWDIVLHHCQTPTDCHEHPQTQIVGPGGRWTPPEHEYPAYIEFRARVTDSRGSTDSTVVRTDPATITLTLASDPPGVSLLGGSESGAAPYDVTVISGSRITVVAPATAVLPSGTYQFESWSDGGPAAHEFVAGTSDAVLTASYSRITGLSHVGTGTRVAGSTTGASVPYPAGVQAGDLLLLGCQGRNNTMDWSASGFTSAARSTVVGGLRHEVLWSWASGAPGGPLAVTNTTGKNGWSCALTAFRGGAGSGNPVLGTPAIASGTGATMTAPATSAAQAGALVTHWYASLDDNDHGSPSSGETLAFGGTGYHTDVGVDHGSSMSYRLATAAGSQPSATMLERANGPDGWTSISIVFAPGGSSPPANRPPVAEDQTVNTAADTPVAVTLRATDPDGDPVQYRVTTLPSHGELHAGTATDPGSRIQSSQLPYLLPGAQVTYVPVAGYVGGDSFAFSASDGSASDAGNVSINVTSTPTPPPGTGWSRVGTGVPVAATGTTASVPYPAGVQAGDLLLLGCQGRNNTMDWSASGFTSAARSTSVSGLRLEVLSAWASGPPPAALGVSNLSGTNGWSCALTAFRGGAGSGNPVLGTPAIASGTGATMTAPATSAAQAGALVTHWYASLDDNDHGSPSSGETLAFGGTGYHTDVGVDHGSSMSYRLATAAGSQPSATMLERANGPDGWTSISIVFAPGTN